MAGVIGPGTLLLCVAGCDDLGLHEGRVYECVEINQRYTWSRCEFDGCDEDGVWIDGQDGWPFCAHRFVPAGRRGDFRAALRTIKSPELEPA